MLQYFVWDIKIFWAKKILKNDIFWIEVFYEWEKTSWEFFIHPIIDLNNKNIVYYAFENIEKKLSFEKMLSIPWVGWKTALLLSGLEKNSLQEAIKTTDIKYFQSIPWVWPKLAKRLLIELKPTLTQESMKSLEKDEKVFKTIQKSLSALGYESEKVKNLLNKCDIRFSKENTSEIIKRVIDNIN